MPVDTSNANQSTWVSRSGGGTVPRGGANGRANPFFLRRFFRSPATPAEGPGDYPPGAAPASTGGFEAVAPDQKTAHRAADPGWAALDLRALPQPAFPGAGHEALGPPSARKLPTQPGLLALELRAPPQPASPGSGHEALSPDRAPRARPAAYPGWAECTLFQPPAPTAGNPLGWEAVAPERGAKHPLVIGWVEYTQFQPPAATAQNPLGWEGVGPWRSPKAPTQPGLATLDLRALPQPPFPGAGHEAVAPGRAPRPRPAPPPFLDAPLFAAPGAAVAANPLGWEGVGPPFFAKRPTQPGALALDLRALPQPAYPGGGHDPQAPHSARRPRHAAGQGFVAFISPPKGGYSVIIGSVIVSSVIVRSVRQ